MLGPLIPIVSLNGAVYTVHSLTVYWDHSVIPVLHKWSQYCLDCSLSLSAVFIQLLTQYYSVLVTIFAVYVRTQSVCKI